MIDRKASEIAQTVEAKACDALKTSVKEELKRELNSDDRMAKILEEKLGTYSSEAKITQQFHETNKMAKQIADKLEMESRVQNTNSLATNQAQKELAASLQETKDLQYRMQYAIGTVSTSVNTYTNLRKEPINISEENQVDKYVQIIGNLKQGKTGKDLLDNISDDRMVESTHKVFMQESVQNAIEGKSLVQPDAKAVTIPKMLSIKDIEKEGKRDKKRPRPVSNFRSKNQDKNKKHEQLKYDNEMADRVRTALGITLDNYNIQKKEGKPLKLMKTNDEERQRTIEKLGRHSSDEYQSDGESTESEGSDKDDMEQDVKDPQDKGLTLHNLRQTKLDDFISVFKQPKPAFPDVEATAGSVELGRPSFSEANTKKRGLSTPDDSLSSVKKVGLEHFVDGNSYIISSDATNSESSKSRDSLNKTRTGSLDSISMYQSTPIGSDKNMTRPRETPIINRPLRSRSLSANAKSTPANNKKTFAVMVKEVKMAELRDLFEHHFDVQAGARRGVTDSQKDKHIERILKLKSCMKYTMNAWRTKVLQNNKDNVITVVGKKFEEVSIPEGLDGNNLSDLTDYLIVDEQLYIKTVYKKMAVSNDFFAGWRTGVWLYPGTILTTLESFEEHTDILGDEHYDHIEVKATIQRLKFLYSVIALPGTVERLSAKSNYLTRFTPKISIQLLLILIKVLNFWKKGAADKVFKPYTAAALLKIYISRIEDGKQGNLSKKLLTPLTDESSVISSASPNRSSETFIDVYNNLGENLDIQMEHINNSKFIIDDKELSLTDITDLDVRKVLTKALSNQTINDPYCNSLQEPVPAILPPVIINK